MTIAPDRDICERGRQIRPIVSMDCPATFPMMFAVVYLSAKLGQVSDKGLFEVIRDHYRGRILRSRLSEC